MPIVREKVKLRVQSFNAGEDSTSETAIVKTPFGTIVRGVDIDQKGKAKQRKGPSTIGDDPDTLIMDMRFHDSATTDTEGNILAANVTATSISYDDGKFGKAAQFNGTTSNIKIDVGGDTTETEISANTMQDFVITAWVYVESDGEGDKGHIIDKSNAASVGASMTTGYRLWTHTESSSTVKLSFEVGYGAGTNALIVSTGTMSTDAWHKIEAHLASDIPALFVDGVSLAGSVTNGVGTIQDDDAVDLYIGNTNTGDGTFDGALEYVRIYDGTRTTTDYEQDKIYGLTRFKIGSTIDQLFRIRDGNLEELDTDFKGWTETATDEFTADKETNFVIAKDLLFILNGTDNVHSMNTSKSVTDEGATSVDPPTKAKVGAWAQNNRLFLSTGDAVVANRDLVYFSNTDAPQTFDLTSVTGNFFKVTSEKAGAITWIAPFKLNELIIYKEDSIHALIMSGSTPLTDWELQPINSVIGCKAGRTVQNLGNDHVFLDNEGKVRLLSRTTQNLLGTSIISGAVQDILDDINIDAISKACSFLVNGKYYLSFPTGTETENNVTVVWDVDTAVELGNPEFGWTVVPDDVWNPAVYTAHEFGDNELVLVHADNRTISSVYRHNVNNDHGAAIAMEVAGPVHDFGERGTEKIFGPLHCVWESGENTTVEMFAEIDEGGFESLGTFSVTGGAPVLPLALEFSLAGASKVEDVFQIKQLGRGKTCRIKAYHKQYNNTATFLEYELWASARVVK